ncbi:molybdopterin-dependent oxidoreductase [Lacisediminihabitans sp.]|jgi:DMSO/TMAO reductase YedYZ molybdopterin-dependent catalytic subunit|uniref:molybdopterin-dependent oxidoreductase n=1 Tax=Lacisediminihabitans sp. TaxID=2787631 RepID=UPI002F94A243
MSSGVGPNSSDGLSPRAARWLAALTGVVAALVVLGVAEAVALLVGPAGSPLFAVGSLVIDLVPPGVKELVISLFGTGDKAVLLTVLGALVVVLAGLAGVLEARRPPWGVVIFGAAGLLAVIAVLTRAGASGFDGAPTIVGAVAGIVVLRIGIRRLARWRAAARPRSGAAGPQVERRSFLTLAIVAGAASILVGAGARAINAGATAVTQVRNRLVLPKPATTASPVAPGAELDIPGLTPIVTPNADFYRIDTALQVPSIDSDTWKLKVTGMVENPIEIDFAELLAKPLIEHMATLTCVSNDVGGNLIGNALWLGYPIRELLKLAVPKAGADMVLSTSIDGFTAGTPLDVLQDDGTEALLAVGMNGKPLPLEHGFPVRMVVPGLYGYVSATKWLVELEVTRFADAQGYWTPRGWSARGPIKLSSRIDTPADGARVDAGQVAIAGVAWAQHTGVQRVEVQVDGGQWAEATLADSISADTWRQWVYRWNATKGTHTVRVRATDANGVTQGKTYVPPAPDGSEGWHEISFSV